MASPIRNYALAQAADPEELVRDVTRMCGEGFQPLGGIAVVREQANATRGVLIARNVYTQAMIKLWAPGEQLIVNGKVHG